MKMKLKDYVTLGNLLCGLTSTIALFFDRFHLACYLVLLGFFFDAADGLVARLTKQVNKFGGELDGLCDMVSYGIAPSFLIYYAFYKLAEYPLWAAVCIAFIPLAMGTIRAARYNVRRAEFDGFFIGLPRTSFAMLVVAVLNSSLFDFLGKYVSSYLYLVPLGTILIGSVLMVTYIPFIGHHNRKFKGMIRFGTWFFLVSLGIGLPLQWFVFPESNICFDVLLFDQLVYLLLGRIVVPKDEWAAVKRYVEEWKAMGK